MEDQIYNVEFIPYYHHIKKKYKLSENETVLYGFIRFYSYGGRDFYFSSDKLSSILNISNIDNPIAKLKSVGLIETETLRMNVDGKFVSRRKCSVLLESGVQKSSVLLESVDSDLLESVDIYKYINIIYNNRNQIKEEGKKLLDEISSSLVGNDTKTDGLTIEQAIDVWNSVSIDKWHKVSANKTTFLYKDLVKKWSLSQKDFTKEEFYKGLENYIAEIGSRKFSNDKGDYFYHRFTFSDFLTRERGLKKFAFI